MVSKILNNNLLKRILTALIVILTLILVINVDYYLFGFLLILFGIKKLFTVLNKTKKINSLFKRIITAVILIPILFYVNEKGGIIFVSFIILIFLLSINEIVKIIRQFKKGVILQQLLWGLISTLYVICSIISLINIRAIEGGIGIYCIYHLFLSIWIFDSAAYFIGSWIKGPKLCPKISPKKTWAGLIGGCFITFILSFLIFSGIMYYIINANISIEIKYFNIFLISCKTVLIGVIGQIGDLLESWFKRKFGVKDSGNILPGHGGILDRMDSIFLASILYYIVFYFSI